MPANTQKSAVREVREEVKPAKNKARQKPQAHGQHFSTVHSASFTPAKPRGRPTPTLPRVLERVFDHHSTPILHSFIQRALAGIAADVYDGQPPLELAALRTLAETASVDTLLALFLLLLNVDTALKQYILESEDTIRRRKITRFFLDLRQTFALNFFNNDVLTRAEFVHQCYEAYLLA